MLFRFFCLLLAGAAAAEQLPIEARYFLEDHCYDCHDSASAKGGLNMEALDFQVGKEENLEAWTHIYDRLQAGEMPPKRKEQPKADDKAAFLKALAAPLIKTDEQRLAQHGRGSLRRLNRYEYENTLREVLQAPWLQVADRLPVDGSKHFFQKSGEQLDISHVQMEAYLKTSRHALELAVQAAAHPSEKKKFYAREEKRMVTDFRYRFGQKSATRASIPMIEWEAQPEVIRGHEPVTVGAKNPEIREKEAIGFVCGTYTATTKYDFLRMNVPTDGRYRLRLKSYSFMAGPNGASGGDDHGLTGGGRAWWRPDRKVVFRSKRSEPVTLYALSASGDSRWLTTYDAQPEPHVIEREVFLKKGEDIRPDATRLVRTRPGWRGNPNATKEGVPGLALNWLEVEGPLHESWPPPSYQALFGEQEFAVKEGEVVVKETAADQLIQRFMQRAFQREVSKEEVARYLAIYQKARKLGEDFTAAMLTTYSAVLCDPDFLFLQPEGAELKRRDLAHRLSYFLWNGPPDAELLEAANPLAQTERMLSDPRAKRFETAFLDSWLDLAQINRDTPDSELYPDYYLDDWLTESSWQETQHYFHHLIAENRPVRELIDSDYAFVNERLARHYDLEVFEGVEPRKVKLPADSPRGGLLTQASVLRVTANGTTTSPILRGVWIVERLLGVEIPPPPSGIEAIEPDTRGATTIREQLTLHSSSESCKACHAKFDPAGFALESFDVAGAWRERYRAICKKGIAVEGIGHNGHLFKFKLAQEVDSAGQISGGREFEDVRGFKELLLKDRK
ncbi:MAG: DUF1588 domain-containing protein, partial [Verrucomicrobiales bacterium]